MTEMMMTFFKSGGVFMFPIAMVGLIALAIVIERMVVMLNYRHQIAKDTRQFVDGMSSEPNEALSQLTQSCSVLADTVRSALETYKTNSISKEEFEELVGISAIHSVRR
jgi:biopolymer transport protein ExbB